MMRKTVFARHFWITAIFLLFGPVAFAQSVEFTVDAPRRVEAGSPFQIRYHLNNQPEAFSAPAFDGITVIAGPSESFGQNVSMRNGQVVASVNYTFTYYVKVDEPGNVTIPAATVTVDGKQFRSGTTIVEVVPAGQNAATTPSQGTGRPPTDQGQAQPATVSSDDIFLRIIPSATEVYKGEPIRVTVKLYSRVPIRGEENSKFPAFNGFWTQEIDVRNSGWQRETYNGAVYEAQVIRDFLVFPQQSGTLQIEQASMTLISQLVTRRQSQSLFDQMFGGGATVQDVRKTVTAGPIRINVKELPAGAPADFTGAVGRFTMEGNISPEALTANSAASYDIRINGAGNFPLINAPTVQLPAAFETYSPTSEDHYSIAGNTFSGYRTFSIPFISRAEGQYTVPPVEFTYFDPSTGKYVTLQTRSHSLEVSADDGRGGSSGIVSGVTKEDLKILDSDIRFIRLGNPHLRRAGSLFLWSWGYLALLVLLVAAFAAVLVYMQKRIRFRSDKTLVRNKRAQKIALRRLKSAEKNMLSKNETRFYEEMLKAMWGYAGDKLNLPVADLSRDKIREGFQAKGLEPVLTDKYVGIIERCEFAQYAPSVTSQVGDIYNAAVELISEIERKIR